MIDKEKYDKIRESGRNFNEEFMVNLWADYGPHFKTHTKKFLYYDPK